MRLVRLFLVFLALTAGHAYAQKPRVPAPLTGTVTTGAWVINQLYSTTPSSPGGFSGMRYNYLLPSGYNPAFSYPIMFIGGGNDEGMNGSTYPRDGGAFVSGIEFDGFTYNTVAFRTAHPAIIVAPQCDQSLDLSGANGNANCGGYNDTPNGGWNEQAISGVLKFMESNFSVDTTRVYAVGLSLSAIGYLAQIVDNNQQNPAGSALWTAAVGMSEQLFRPATPNSNSFARMASVPYLAISTPSDNVPASWDQPFWTFNTGNTSYPTQSNYDSGGMAAIRAGTSQYYYIASSGSPWSTFGPSNADGGDGTTWQTWLFSQQLGASVTPSRSADFLNMIAVQGCLTGGGAAACTSNNGSNMLADLQYLGVKHVRSGLDVTLTAGSPDLLALTTLVNNGISFLAGPPYPSSPTSPSTLTTTTPANQISQLHAWQAINPNAIWLLDGINEPGLLFPTVVYGSSGVTASNPCTGSGGAGGDGCTWTPVVQYQRDYVTALLADSALKNIPILTLSRGGEEPTNAGAQFATIQGNSSTLPAGTVLGQVINNHVYPTDQQQYFYTVPGTNPPYPINTSAIGACQPNDPTAGSAFNIQTHFDNVVTFNQDIAGYASDAAAQALPRAVTEFGYPSVGIASAGDAVTEDKKGRCILNGLLTAWQTGMQAVAIYGMYSGFTSKADSYGLMSANATPQTSGIYLHNFTSPLVDNGATARTFSPVPLNVGFTGLCSACTTQLFQKSNGHYEIVVWSNATNWNLAAGTAITVAPTSVGINLPASGTATVYDSVGGTIVTHNNATNVSISVADYPIVVDYVAGSASTPSPNNTVVLAGSSQVITDSNLNAWGISAGQVTFNGVVLGTTANVTEIAYVSTVVWQLNSSGNWFSFTSTGGIASGPTTTSPLPTQNFKVSGGHILTPSGAIFNGRGIAIYDNDINSVITNAAAQPLTTLFPKVNFLRLSMGLNGATCSSPYNFNILLPAQFQAAVNEVTALGIVAIVDNLAFPQTCSVQTGTALTAEVGWYQAWATAFKGNPYVWFETPNEPLWNNEQGSQATVTAEQVAIYNGIRAVGNNSMVVLEEVAGGPNYVLGINCSSGACLSPASAYQSMTNVAWDLHTYAYCCNGQTTLVPVSTIVGDIQANIALAQQFTSADGTVPVISGEYGNSTDGVNLDVSGQNTVVAVEQVGNPTQAFVFNAAPSPNSLGNFSGLTNPYGTTVAAYIAAGSGPITGNPTLSAPATITPPISTVTAVAGVSATDSANPNDTETFVGTSTGSGTLSAVGATGNGTGTLTFSGSLTALNTLMGTITFTDAVQENPTITFTMQDQHSLSASATTAVTVVGGLSPNCTIVTTVGPVITSAGPPSATWSINSSGQIVVNGQIDTTTANVGELAYVNGLVWQGVTTGALAGDWWSKSSPSDGWTGPTTTSPTSSCSAAPPLTISAPTVISSVFNATTAIPSVSVADPGFPNDTMSFQAVSTLNGALSATGMTGNGTGTLTFSGSLTALNTALQSLSIVIPGPNVVYAGTTGTFISNGTWSISPTATVLLNGSAAAFSANVALIALVGGVVWQENTANQWYFWNGSGWTAGTDPIGISATATVISGSGLTFTDASSNVWSIDSGNGWQVFENGALPNGQFSSNVAQIDLVSGVVWSLNKSGQWYFWTGTAWTAGANPLGAHQTITVTLSAGDQHSNTGTAIATINVTISNASPNYTITRSVGVGVNDMLGEQFTIVSNSTTNLFSAVFSAAFGGTATGTQIAVNGVVDSTTSNVVELAYVNGNIWYETSSGDWFDKATAAATWAGPTTSPLNRFGGVQHR